jgi:predicted dehydrogenase
MSTSTNIPIRLALLGIDAQTLAIALAATDSARFDLVGACEVESCLDQNVAAEFAMHFPRIRRIDAWESLLTGQYADVVVVARSQFEDLRAEQLRKLIQTSVPVLTSQPVQDSMLVYYELDMIRRDTNSLVMPYLPERHHPAVQAVRNFVAQAGESPLGAIQHIDFQRRLGSPDKRVVSDQFARDVDIIRAVAGDMTRLGAMAGAQSSDNFAGLGVQMTGPAGVSARWTVEPLHTEPGGQLTLLGSRGKATIEIRPDELPWSLELAIGGKTDRQTFAVWNPAVEALDQLAQALQGEPVEPDWVDAARAVELAETIPRSLHKSRTIDLYYEDYTEQSTFKGLMASIGCGLLIFGLIVMGGVAIGDLMGLPVQRSWAYLLAGGMGIFLLLQLLMLVFRGDSPHGKEGPVPTADK